MRSEACTLIERRKKPTNLYWSNKCTFLYLLEVLQVYGCCVRFLKLYTPVYDFANKTCHLTSTFSHIVLSWFAFLHFQHKFSFCCICTTACQYIGRKISSLCSGNSGRQNKEDKNPTSQHDNCALQRNSEVTHIGWWKIWSQCSIFFFTKCVDCILAFGYN